jgi:hypothetical protein
MNMPALQTPNRLVETLDVSVTNGNQNVDYTWLFKLDRHKARIRIHSNPYGFQSWAVSEIWSADALRWNEVARLGESDRHTPNGLTYHPNWRAVAPFEADAQRLLALTLAILL